jgi:c-di-GMP-binding flagellar brake protein YcgR
MIQGWKEKRKHPRVRVHCPISFMSFDQLRIGETADLSLGGMKIQCRAILLKGQVYDFTVVMNGRAIYPKGRVVYLQNQPEFTYGAGVFFLHLSEEHQVQLSGFLSAQKLEQSPSHSCIEKGGRVGL